MISVTQWLYLNLPPHFLLLFLIHRLWRCSSRCSRCSSCSSRILLHIGHVLGEFDRQRLEQTLLVLQMRVLYWIPLNGSPRILNGNKQSIWPIPETRIVQERNSKIPHIISKIFLIFPILSSPRPSPIAVAVSAPSCPIRSSARDSAPLQTPIPATDLFSN